MRFYTVYLRKTADPLFTPDLGVQFVREGFNGAAFLFTWIWALVAGLWVAAAILFAGDVALALVHEWIDLGSLSLLLVTLGWHVVVGFIAEDLRRWSLHLHGYTLAEIVAGESLAAAERRFFEHHPAMATPAWR
jgi:hypothetical protein